MLLPAQPQDGSRGLVLAQTHWGMEFSSLFSGLSLKKMSKVKLLFIYLFRTCSGCLRGNQEEKKALKKWENTDEVSSQQDLFIALSF